MTDRGFEVLHHLIRQTAIVVMGGGLIVALVLKALSETTFSMLFAAVVAGKAIEHFRGRPVGEARKEPP
jgi:hypothetical protein